MRLMTLSARLVTTMIVLVPSVTGFVTRSICKSSISRCHKLYSSISTSNQQQGISRMETLQTLIQKFGVPGATICNKPNDLQPINPTDYSDIITLQNLHPHLYPIARSTQNPNYFICALKRPSSFDDSSNTNNEATPWPIVESKVHGPGYALLSLHGEHLMRRIVAQADFLDTQPDLVELYNQGLGQGILRDRALDIPYERGSVKKLGYGLDKYILLRVGPFPDLYINMSRQHLQKKDESSSLIAAESANSKFTGFASTFLNYSKLLSSMNQRQEESRDAARVCLRLPLSSIGMEEEDLIQTALLADLITPNNKEEDDSLDEENKRKNINTLALEKLKEALDKIREKELGDERTRASMTPTQLAIEEANYLLDQTTLNAKNRDWSSIRMRLSGIYASVGMIDMSSFVNPSFQ